jgi:hypothetical protein
MIYSSALADGIEKKSVLLALLAKS